MTEVKWIKVDTGIFENRKIRLIESLPDGDTVLVIWFKLLCLAGACNDKGKIGITPTLAYTQEQLATIINKPLCNVTRALQLFVTYGMITLQDDFIQLNNWEKYQNAEALQRIREQTRIRVAKFRNKNKQNELCIEDDFADNAECNVTVTQDKRYVTQQNKSKSKSKNKSSSTTTDFYDKAYQLYIDTIGRGNINSTTVDIIKGIVDDFGYDVYEKAIAKATADPTRHPERMNINYVEGTAKGISEYGDFDEINARKQGKIPMPNSEAEFIDMFGEGAYRDANN